MAPVENPPGVLIVNGEVPDKSIALAFASDLVAEGTHIVAVTDLTHANEPTVKREGLPTTIIVDPVPISDN